MSEALSNLIGFFQRGGLFMWPLLICSIVALTTIILRGFALREKNVMPLVIESEIERLLPGGSAERLMRIVENDQSSLGRIVRVALQHLRSPRSRIGARFLAPRTKLGRVRYASNCTWHRGGVECDRLRPFHCRANAGRLQLLFKKGRSNVSGNGNAGGGADREMLFRAGRPGRIAAGTDDSANASVNKLVGIR